MYSSIASVVALVSLANAHGVILGAQGIAGSPSSVGFQGESYSEMHLNTFSDSEISRLCHCKELHWNFALPAGHNHHSRCRDRCEYCQ